MEVTWVNKKCHWSHRFFFHLIFLFWKIHLKAMGPSDNLSLCSSAASETWAKAHLLSHSPTLCWDTMPKSRHMQRCSYILVTQMLHKRSSRWFPYSAFTIVPIIHTPRGLHILPSSASLYSLTSCEIALFLLDMVFQVLNNLLWSLCFWDTNIFKFNSH